MGTTPRSSIGQAALPNSANAKVAPDIADLSLDATLVALHANPDTGLTQAEIDTQREAHGYNEVAEKKRTHCANFLENSGESPRGCSNSSWFSRPCSNIIPILRWWARCW